MKRKFSTRWLLSASEDPADKTYAGRLKAGAILEKLFEQEPDHPGLAHYIIHTYDVPPLAGRALAAARRYSEIAPDAPHALHMPSHTFTRTGYWQDSIDSNVKAVAAAKREKTDGGRTARQRLRDLRLPANRAGRRGAPCGGFFAGNRIALRSERRGRRRWQSSNGILCTRGDPGTIRPRAPRVEAGLATHAEGYTFSVHGSHVLVRPRIRRSALGTNAESV